MEYPLPRFRRAGGYSIGKGVLHGMVLIQSEQEIIAARLPQEIEGLLRLHWQAWMQEIDRLGGGYDPRSDGHFVYLGKGEGTQTLLKLMQAQRLCDLIVEYVDHFPESRLYRAVFIISNDYGLSVYVLDHPEMDPDLQLWLINHIIV
jgi:hypothetical protein